MASSGPGSISTPAPELIDPRTRFNDLILAVPPPAPVVLQRDFPTQPDSGETSYKGSNRLLNRRALITGGDSGIGRAVTLAMAREGAKVAINYLPEEEPDATSLFNLLAREGKHLERIPGNLLDEGFAAYVVEKARKELGGLDILVNNAGAMGNLNEDIATYTTANLDRVFRTNIYTGIWLTRAAVSYMPPGSSIIWTASDVAFNTTNSVHDYAASKSGVASLVRSLGISLLSRYGIRVNGVAPGLVYTPFPVQAGLTNEGLGQAVLEMPLRRFAQPAELAGTYVNLADAMATQVSGTVVQINGGANGGAYF